eukprot:1815130-Prymnesium_polylepis.1
MLQTTNHIRRRSTPTRTRCHRKIKAALSHLVRKGPRSSTCGASVVDVTAHVWLAPPEATLSFRNLQ